MLPLPIFYWVSDSRVRHPLPELACMHVPSERYVTCSLYVVHIRNGHQGK